MFTKSNPLISIITSARNESEGIPNLMRYISVLNGSCNSEVEFIVIDNNSTDNSHQIMRRECHHIPNVKIFRLESSKSFQEGVQFGINVASSKNIVLFPSDLQHPVEDCIVLLKAFEDALKTNERIAIFTRRVRLDGFRNRMRGRIYRIIIKFLCPVLLSDPSSPLKAFTLNEGLIPKSSKFLVFDIEFQYNWLKTGETYREIDSFFVPRRTGKSNFSLNVREILSCLAYVRRLNTRDQRS
jgi:glycosyltransferase involved in cell wall biosynthesis